MQAEAQKQLEALIGLKLSIARRFANLRAFLFGAIRLVEHGTVGEYALHYSQQLTKNLLGLPHELMFFSMRRFAKPLYSNFLRQSMSNTRISSSFIQFRASFWIVAILLLAAILRIINAGHFPVWTDEGWSTWAISSYHFDTILTNLAGDRHPPLYFLVLSAFSSAVGYSRIALRFVSISAGLLIVALTYRIGREWFNRTIALFAALFIAVLPSAVYYAQEIRDYGWLTMVGLLMTLFFLRFLHQPRRSTAIAYAFCVALMFYTNYIGVFLLAIQVAIGLLFWRSSIRNKLTLIGVWVLAVILYIPWLPAVLSQAGHLSAGIGGDPNTLAGWLKAI